MNCTKNRTDFDLYQQAWPCAQVNDSIDTVKSIARIFKYTKREMKLIVHFFYECHYDMMMDTRVFVVSSNGNTEATYSHNMPA